MTTEIQEVNPGDANQGLSGKMGDLASCNNDPIQFIGSIQNHGSLILFSAPDFLVHSVSQNLLSTNPVGKKLDSLIDREACVQIRELLAVPSGKKNLNLYFKTTIYGVSRDAHLFFADQLYCLEFENLPKPLTRATEIDYTMLMKEFINDVKETGELTQLSHLTCVKIRQLTGLDRVMLYRFLPPHWHGEVIGEDRVIHSHSFMGHRFPSSDIPKPARDLYLKNQSRMIPDVDAAILPLSPAINPRSGKHYDLSDSRLRAVSPIHLQYLRNMEVKASLSFAITVKNQLWGLIACHHLDTFFISHSQREACEFVAGLFSAQAPLLENIDQYRARNSFETKLRNFLERLDSSARPEDELVKKHQAINNVFDAVGIAIIEQDGLDFAGLTPRKTELMAIADQVRKKMEEKETPILPVQSIVSELGKFNEIQFIGGLLAVRLSEKTNSLLMIFRPEVIRTIKWGGNPNKQLADKNFGGEMNPRTSFEEWEETIRGSSKEWTAYEMDGLLFIRNFLFDDNHS